MSQSICPNEASFVPGPTEPTPNLGIESVRDNFSDPWSWELPLETLNESVKGNRVSREKLKNHGVQVPENTTRDTRERGYVPLGTRDTRDTRDTLNIGSISSKNNNEDNSKF